MIDKIRNQLNVLAQTAVMAFGQKLTGLVSGFDGGKKQLAIEMGYTKLPKGT